MSAGTLVSYGLPPIYHWSPRGRRAAIETSGLEIRKEAVTHTDSELVVPYLSFSPDPARAWQLSGAISSEVDEWDLWQIWVGPQDEVVIRPNFGPEIHEIKVYGGIPRDRLWFVGERSVPAFEKGESR